MTSSELQTVVLGLNSELVVRDGSAIWGIKIPLESFYSIMTILKSDPRLSFDMLQFHTAIDLPTEKQIECLYMLNSSTENHELLVSVTVPRENPVLKSVSSLWAIAEWQEREVYDMFGVYYENHPDLRRIFLEDDWQGFPLRKDYVDDFMLRRPW